MFQRVVSDLDTLGLAQSASEVTVGTADTTGDGNEELVLGFDYSSGVIVTYTTSSSRELTAGQYDNYLFSSGNSNVVTDSTVDSANGTFLLDTGYTDYYGEGFGAAQRRRLQEPGPVARPGSTSAARSYTYYRPPVVRPRARGPGMVQRPAPSGAGRAALGDAAP